MSKLKYILLLLAIAVFPQVLKAERVKIGELYYELNHQEKTAVVKQGEYKFQSLTIPKEITYNSNHYSVVSIGENAFKYCFVLNSIDIPNSVTSIGNNAFRGCNGLTNITIPNSVISIGFGAFQYCKKLEKVDITDIEAWCKIKFDGFDSNPLYYAGHLYLKGVEIKDLVIPISITSIGNYAFSGCRGLNSVTIPNSVTEIGARTFEGCSGLTRVYITDLEAWCKIKFDCNTSNPLSFAHHLYLNGIEIKDLIIPTSVTSVGNYAFSGCSGLTSVTIPNSVTEIGARTFVGCKGLTNITISNSVTSIGVAAFASCSGLNSVTIPNSVTEIGARTFEGCKGLTNITISNSVTSIGVAAFASCSGINSINIPNSVIYIANSAFSGCSNLTSINIPKSITFIENSVFWGCSELSVVTIPNSVTSIGNYAFADCGRLTDVTIPNSVTSIGKDAFYGCSSLKKIIAPQNLVSKLRENYKNIDIVTSETYYSSKDSDKENQKTGQRANSDKNLANANSSSKKNNEIKKEKAKNDKTTSAKKSEYQELNDNMLSWEEFYRRNRKVKLTYEDVSQIEAHINREIEKWQVKDEFESTNEWRARVNETTRQQKVKELSAPLIEQHNREVAQINEEQKRLAQEYEKYRQDLIDGYYRNLTAQATKDFSAGDFSLNPYDADHGTFLIRSARYGDILLPIAARDEARSFKDNWETIKRNVKPEFVPNGEEVALTKLVFTNNGKQYVYDSHTEANYAVTDVKYNFKPVELADISLADINTNLPALTNSDVSAQIISKTSNEAITPQRVQPSKNTVVASDRSDVDYAIPTGYIDDRSNTFAVIIANEDYTSNARVPYAANDGEIMARYLTSAVGLPGNHVKVYRNATYGKMAEAVNYIEKLGEAYGEKINLIFYYAGHGVPDEKTKTALLLPVDGNPSISKTCYSVEELVKNLGNLKANNVILMIDACFSGATRYDDLLVAASGNRGVRLRTNDISPIGNMVVLTATQGDETAYPYEKEQHGLFTYFLLRKLQENKGKVTLGELADYVIENVKQTSIVNNGKLQTPTVTVSPSLVGSWRDIPLK